jgi:hypothetical protein
MPRTKVGEFAKGAVEVVAKDIVPEGKDRITADSRQAQEHYEKWDALIAHVKLVHKLSAKLRKRLEDHANVHPEAEPPPADHRERLAHVRAQAEALQARYGSLIQEITEWANGLQQFDFANAGGVPIFSAVRDLNEAMSRALRVGPPPEPPLDINNYASVQARLSYLHTLEEEMTRFVPYSPGPSATGSSISQMYSNKHRRGPRAGRSTIRRCGGNHLRPRRLLACRSLGRRQNRGNVAMHS